MEKIKNKIKELDTGVIFAICLIIIVILFSIYSTITKQGDINSYNSQNKINKIIRVDNVKGIKILEDGKKELRNNGIGFAGLAYDNKNINERDLKNINIKFQKYTIYIKNNNKYLEVIWENSKTKNKIIDTYLFNKLNKTWDLDNIISDD